MKMERILKSNISAQGVTPNQNRNPNQQGNAGHGTGRDQGQHDQSRKQSGNNPQSNKPGQNPQRKDAFRSGKD